MRLNYIRIALLPAFAVIMYSCEEKIDSFTAADKLKKIAQLNSALAPCSDLSIPDSVTACATTTCRQVLQEQQAAAIIFDIWIKYAQANALSAHYGEKAIALIDQTLPKTEDYPLLFERAQLLSLRSYINTRSSNRQLAVYDAYQAADIYMELGLHSAAAVCYLNIANVQYNAGNHQIAIENALQSATLYSESHHLSRGDSLRWLNAYNTIGMSYAALQDYTRAAEYYHYGMDLAEKLHHALWAGIITGNMGKLDLSEGDYDEAWAKLNVNIRVGLKFNELASAGFALMGQAEILEHKGMLYPAKIYYDSAWALMRKERRPEIWIIYFQKISTWYEMVKQYDSANASYKRYIAFRDSTQGVPASQLLRLQNQIQFEKQVSLLRAENDLKKSNLKTSYVIILSFIAILILLSLLFFSLRRNYRNINALNDALERKVKERTNELVRLNKELDTYLYRASHDVRRPILSIIGLGRLAVLARDESERQAIQQKIDITAHDMDRMLSKIRMAYELDKLEDVQHVDISAYLSSLLARLGKSNPEVKFDLSITNPVILSLSVSLLDVIFINLIENACTFRNPVDPTVNLTVICRGNHVQVSVKDNGIGIDPKYLETIFSPYTRYSERSVGSGLGLHLTQKAVHKLKGNITVESTLYLGSEFRIKIPLRIDVDTEPRASETMR
jgi:signal transduction histidine kinase